MLIIFTLFFSAAMLSLFDFHFASFMPAFADTLRYAMPLICCQYFGCFEPYDDMARRCRFFFH